MIAQDEPADLERQVYEQFRDGLTQCDAALLQDAIGAMIQIAITEAIERLADKFEPAAMSDYTAIPATDYEVDSIRNCASFCSDLNLCGTPNIDVLKLIALVEELKNEKASLEYRLDEMTEDRDRWEKAYTNAWPKSEAETIYMASERVLEWKDVADEAVRDTADLVVALTEIAKHADYSTRYRKGELQRDLVLCKTIAKSALSKVVLEP